MSDPICRRCAVRYQQSRLEGVCDLCERAEIAALQNMTRDDMMAALAGGPLAANAWQPEKEAELQRFREREPLVQALLDTVWDHDKTNLDIQVAAETVDRFKVSSQEQPAAPPQAAG